MHDPLFDTTSDAASDATGRAVSDATGRPVSDATGRAVSDTPATGTPPMAPPTGLPVVAQPYQWPAAVGAPMAPVPPPAVGGQRPDTYRGLAIAAFALSVLAVIGVLLFGLGVIDRPVPSASDSASSQPDDPNSMPMGPLTGSVPVAAGTSLPGDDLAHAVEQRIHDDGASDITMDCPGTRKVAQGVVTVCHGQIEGDDWAVVVYFEDELGSFTLNPL